LIADLRALVVSMAYIASDAVTTASSALSSTLFGTVAAVRNSLQFSNHRPVLHRKNGLEFAAVLTESLILATLSLSD